MGAYQRVVIKRIQESRDLDDLRDSLQALVGQVCWRVRFSAGDEVVLEIGDHTPDPLPKGLGSIPGYWTIGTRGSDWVLSRQDVIVAQLQQILEHDFRDSAAIAAEHMKTITGLRIVAVDIAYPDLALTLGFEHDVALRIAANHDEDDYGVSDWEVFMPDGTLLDVGPGMKWRTVAASRQGETTHMGADAQDDDTAENPAHS